MNGTVAVTGNLIVQRDATLTPDGPFQPDDGVAPAEDPIQLGINPTDEDGVLPAAGSYDLDLSGDGSNDHLLLTDQADIRYGRLVVENAYGPENRDLPMPVTAEYWDGAAFVKNLDDSCSALLRDAGVLDGVLPTAVAEPIVTTPLVSGEGVLLLSAPGVSGTTELRLDLNDDGLGEPTLNLPWLQFDWDGTGVATDPTGLATFGRFRGHDRIILWRELN